jgi:hypothetical protein
MKNLIFAFIILLFFSCQGEADVQGVPSDTTSSKNSPDLNSQEAQPDVVESEDDKFIRSLIEEDVSELRNTLRDLKNQKDEESFWLESDLTYYSLWLRGVENEMIRNYSESIGFYKKSLNTERHEASSFKVKMPLARVYLTVGNYEKSIQLLKEYINEAREEIKYNDDDLWVMTEEGIKRLKRDIRIAQKLIDIARKRSV